MWASVTSKPVTMCATPPFIPFHHPRAPLVSSTSAATASAPATPLSTLLTSFRTRPTHLCTILAQLPSCINLLHLKARYTLSQSVTSRASMAATAPPAPAPEASAPPAPATAVPLPAPVLESPTTPTTADSKAIVPAEAGAVVPHGETEPGTIIHMEKATQKIEHDKIIARAKAWEEDALARIESRNQREEAKINQEELTMKNKAEARLRKNEEKLEKLKATYMEQLKNEIAAAHKAAEEKRALVAAKKGQDILKTEEMAAKIRATGIFPKKFGCFAA